jgi:hypothetical protein
MDTTSTTKGYKMNLERIERIGFTLVYLAAAVVLALDCFVWRAV